MKDLQAIIKSCKKNGVASLKFGLLEINFEKSEPKLVNKAPSELVSVFAEQEIKDFPRIGAQELVEDFFELDDLKINDPEAYEKFIASEENSAREN